MQVIASMWSCHWIWSRLPVCFWRVSLHCVCWRNKYFVKIPKWFCPYKSTFNAFIILDFSRPCYFSSPRKFQIYIFILRVQVHGDVYWHPLHVLFTSLPSPWSGISAPRRCLRCRQTNGSEVGGEGRTQPLSYHRTIKWEHHVIGSSFLWLN